MTSQELALRTSIPPELQAAGVKIEQDADGGYTAITFPDEIHERYNVLLPVSEIVRSDPSWTPNPRAIRLSIETHTYKDTNAPEGTRSLNKLGLFALAQVSGLGIPVTRRMPARDLGEGKIGWQATVFVRRSDGTQDPVTASKVVDVEVERAKIEAGVRKGKARNNWSQEKARGIYEQRWLYEREHMESKAETKAIERAIRAALQIPAAIRESELAKPFLVVGYSFTPDPETARALALSAQSRLYGPDVANGHVAIEASASPSPPESEAEEQPAPEPRAAADEEGKAAPDTTDGGKGAAPAPASDFEGEEPADPSPFQPPDAQARDAASAALSEFPSGKYGPNGDKNKDNPRGLTIGQVFEKDPGYVKWAVGGWQQEPFKSSLAAFARVHMPDAVKS